MESRMTPNNTIRFYLLYFTAKVFLIWKEVKTPKLTLFLYEMMYSLHKFIDPVSTLISPFKTDRVDTVFGNFVIRPHTDDMFVASPAYERNDLDYILSLADKLAKRKKSIVFIDIGAHFGKYTVALGNRLKTYKKFRIFAFEPSNSSYALLKKNISLNRLDKKVTVFKIALLDQDNKKLKLLVNPSNPTQTNLYKSKYNPRFTDFKNFEPMVSKTLDTVLKSKLKNADAIIIKIDVEGSEYLILKGTRKILASAKELYIMGEDQVNSEYAELLGSMHAECIGKFTPYNCWWRITSA